MRLLSVLTVCVSSIMAEKVKIGELGTFHHDVSGTVSAVDDNTLVIENFNYDGAGWYLHQSYDLLTIFILRS